MTTKSLNAIFDGTVHAFKPEGSLLVLIQGKNEDLGQRGFDAVKSSSNNRDLLPEDHRDICTLALDCERQV